jgi:hypothetical protein
MNIKFLIKMKLVLILGLILMSASMHGHPGTIGEDGDEYLWTDIKELGIRGKGWVDDPLLYNRLPAKAETLVREAVWDLSHHTAGFFVQFKSNATSIMANWKLTEEKLAFPHMAGTGVSGLDLYVKTGDGSWHWLGIGKPDSIENTFMLVEGLSEAPREYLLNLPLYNGIEFVKLGVPAPFKIESVPPDARKPIVFYGTSITQGGCASRPGMCATAILGRSLDREIINLGFSGNGRMEPELAELLAELDPLVYFIDCLPNLMPDDVAERVEPFVEILRAAHPETPIVLAEGITYNNAFLVQNNSLENANSWKALRNAYENLLNRGTKHLYYQIAEGQLGFDGEGTVDGVHPTDLGFYRQAGVYQLILENIIKGSNCEK